MRRISKGFSLVELMIVVAIIGILAAIAIPNFIAMQLKAKRSEVPGNVDGIKTAELAYDAAFDAYVPQVAPQPTTPGKSMQTFVGAGTGFETIGWKPDGTVRGSYAVPTTSATDFTISASSDVDGDLVTADYTATSSLNATLASADANVY